MTVEEAVAAMHKGARVQFTVEPGHIMHVWTEDGVMYSEAQMPAWSAGVIEPVCALSSAYLREYLANRDGLSLVKR